MSDRMIKKEGNTGIMDCQISRAFMFLFHFLILLSFYCTTSDKDFKTGTWQFIRPSPKGTLLQPQCVWGVPGSLPPSPQPKTPLQPLEVAPTLPMAQDLRSASWGLQSLLWQCHSNVGLQLAQDFQIILRKCKPPRRIWHVTEMAYASLSRPKVFQHNMGDHNHITKQIIATSIRTFFGVMADPLLNDCRLEFFSSRLLITVDHTNANFSFCTTAFFY